VTKEQQATTASGLVLVAGLWLIISPFVLGYSSVTAATWGSIIVGIIIATIAAVRAFRPGEVIWLSWVNVVLGVWLVLTPFIYGLSGDARVLYNHIIVGLIVVVLAAWSALSTRAMKTF